MSDEKLNDENAELDVSPTLNDLLYTNKDTWETVQLLGYEFCKLKSGSQLPDNAIYIDSNAGALILCAKEQFTKNWCGGIRYTPVKKEDLNEVGV